MENDVRLLNEAGDTCVQNEHLTRPVTVWLVDDCDDLRGLLRRLLNEQSGLECEREFRSAESFLFALQTENPPQVILLDNNMGGMSGLKAIPQVKKLAPDARVLMLTTFFDLDLKLEVIKAGAAGFLLKSYSIDTIAGKIHEAARFGQVAEPEQPLDAVAQSRPASARGRISPGLRLGRWLRHATRFEDAMDPCAGTP